MLLIDYLEDATSYLQEKTTRLRKLDDQYRKIYDRDIKREIGLIKQEIRKKRSEIINNILLNLDEFTYLNKYFPELLQTFIEDEYIGKIISKKVWLLNFKQMPPKEAVAMLEQIKSWRMQLKDAKKLLITKWVGKVDSRAFVATYPMLKGHIKNDLERDEVITIIDRVDKGLLREGWLILITDALIEIPIAKFMTKISRLQYLELMANGDFTRARGRGTVGEVSAMRKLEKIKRKKQHYENILTQVLLANPAYLRKLKTNKNWLAKNKQTTLQKFVECITPHKVKERAWFNEMKKRLSMDD